MFNTRHRNNQESYKLPITSIQLEKWLPILYSKQIKVQRPTGRRYNMSDQILIIILKSQELWEVSYQFK